jgi:hypothetical protein
LITQVWSIPFQLDAIQEKEIQDTRRFSLNAPGVFTTKEPVDKAAAGAKDAVDGAKNDAVYAAKNAAA